MIAAVLRGPDRMFVEEVETPGIGPGDILVEVGANTICGTDVRLLRGEKSRGTERPSIIGHEFAGRVVETGQRVGGFEAGQPVAIAPMVPCRRCFYCKRGMENACTDKIRIGYELDGGLGEYVRIPAEAIEAGNVFAVREDLPSAYLALAEPLSCCINGQRHSRIGPHDAVLILGAGPIGLFHLQLALLAGARTVIVSEPSSYRREFAAGLGAHFSVDPTSEDLASVVGEATDGIGADAAIICIGLPQLVNEALGLVRKGGTVNVFAGLADRGWAGIEANLIHYNELVVTGSTDSRRVDFETALQLIESGRIQVEPMLTHRYPLEAANEALETAAAGKGIKVAVLPWEFSGGEGPGPYRD